MSDAKELVGRIEQYMASLSSQPVTETVRPLQPPQADPSGRALAIRSALSGAFGEAIDVFIGEGEDAGAYLALVPIAHLRSTGLKIVESVVVPRVASRDRGTGSKAVTGSPEAVENAERRVAKFLGEGWSARLDSFPLHEGAADALYFRITPSDASADQAR